VGDPICAGLAVCDEAPSPELALSAWGQGMTRSGFEGVLGKHVDATAARCPPLRAKRYGCVLFPFRICGHFLPSFQCAPGFRNDG
jgi:hypothetical protein